MRRLTRSFAWLAALPCLGLIALGPAPAFAETIALGIAADAEPPAGLEADFASAGHEVVPVALRDDLPMSGLVELLEGVGARALVRLLRGTAELWFATDVGWTFDEAIRLDEESARLRIVEVVRARLAEPERPMGAQGDPPAGAAPTAPSSPRFAWLLDVGVFASPPFSVGSAARLGAFIPFLDWVGMTVRLGGSMLGVAVRVEEGSARLWPIFGALHATFLLASAGSPVGVRLDAGVVAGVVVVDGEAARDPWVGGTAVTGFVGPSAGVGLDLSFGAGGAITLGLEVGLNASGLGVGIAEREVARFGEPFLLGTVGMAVFP